MDYEKIIKNIPTTAAMSSMLRCDKCGNKINSFFSFCNFCGHSKTSLDDVYGCDYYSMLLGKAPNNLPFKTTVFYFKAGGEIYEKTNIEYSVKVIVFGGGTVGGYKAPIYIFPAFLDTDDLNTNLSKKALYVHGFDIDCNYGTGKYINIRPCIAHPEGDKYVIEKKGTICFSKEQDVLPLINHFNDEDKQKFCNIKKINL